jgi:transposase
MKVQILIKQRDRKVLKTNFCNGKKHDFKLFKESRIPIQKDTNVKADTGYQGIQTLHKNSTIPKKKTKKNPLSKEDKRQNREISRQRIAVENVLCMLKRFKVLSDRYRNRRKRFALRFNLIAGMYNYEL